MIMSGELAVGSRINESELATALQHQPRPGARGAARAGGSGPGAQREEPRRVRARDLHSRKPTRSTSCARGSTNSSGGAWREPSRPMPAASALKAMLSRWTTAAKAQGRRAATTQLNLQFHDVAGRHRRQRELLETYRRLIKELQLFRHARAATDGGGLRVSIDEHREIVEAIASRRRRARRPRACATTSTDSRARMHKATGRARRRARLAPRSRAVNSTKEHEMKRRPSKSMTGSYRWMSSPLVVVCVDGCEYDYLDAAVEAGVAPFLARMLEGAAPICWATAWCPRSPTRTTSRSSPARRRRCTASAATTSSTATPARK